jgi:hypothetical protein
VLRLRDSEGVPVGERDCVGLRVRDTEVVRVGLGVLLVHTDLLALCDTVRVPLVHCEVERVRVTVAVGQREAEPQEERLAEALGDLDILGEAVLLGEAEAQADSESRASVGACRHRASSRSQERSAIVGRQWGCRVY